VGVSTGVAAIVVLYGLGVLAPIVAAVRSARAAPAEAVARPAPTRPATTAARRTRRASAMVRINEDSPPERKS
jgi:hypothetical protein